MKRYRSSRETLKIKLERQREKRKSVESVS